MTDDSLNGLADAATLLNSLASQAESEQSVPWKRKRDEDTESNGTSDRAQSVQTSGFNATDDGEPPVASTSKPTSKTKKASAPIKRKPVAKDKNAPKRAYSKRKPRERVQDTEYDGGSKTFFTTVQAKAYNAESEDEDDRLYCICQQLYDPNRLMIACDNCDDWYHTTCMDMNEEDVELVNDFVCPKCESSTGKKTSWKARCLREGCTKSQVALSKYCSDECGIEVTALKLEACSLQPQQIWQSVLDASKRRGLVILANSQSSFLPLNTSESPPSVVRSRRQQEASDMPTSPIRLESALSEAKSKKNSSVPEPDSLIENRAMEIKTSRLRASLEDIDQQRKITTARIDLLDARLRFLELAVKKWESMVAEHVKNRSFADSVASSSPAGKAQARGSKAAAAKSERIAADAPCGFDVRLVWDDQDWETWVHQFSMGEHEGIDLYRLEEKAEEEDEVGNVCTISKKRCDRHEGWQLLQEAVYENEKTVFAEKLERLAIKEKALHEQMHSLAKRKEIVNRFRTPTNGIPFDLPPAPPALVLQNGTHPSTTRMN